MWPPLYLSISVEPRPGSAGAQASEPLARTENWLLLQALFGLGAIHSRHKSFQGLLSTRFNLHSLPLALCWPVPPWTRAPAGLLLPASPATAPLPGAALFLNPSAVGQDSQSRPVWRRCGWVPMCCILRDAKNNSEQRSLLLAPSLLCTLHHLIQHKTAACAAGLLVLF